MWSTWAVQYDIHRLTSHSTQVFFFFFFCTDRLLSHVRWSVPPPRRRSAQASTSTHRDYSILTMKISAAIALVAVGGASAYSVDRSSLRSLGQKSIGSSARSHVRSNDIKMEGEWQAQASFVVGVVLSFCVAPPPRPRPSLLDSSSPALPFNRQN